MGSAPTVAISMPIPAASKPFSIESPDRTATTVSAKISRQAISAGPNLRANCASCGAIRISSTMLNSPP